MAEKIISGDSLQSEFVTKFNGMVDDVNELKESGGGGAVVELSGESGTLTDKQYAQCTNPTTVIKWFNGSGAHIVYEYWNFASPTYEFKSVYIDADECINNTIEIDQISHGWKRKSTAYSGGGSTVSVTQTLTSGTKIGAITVDGKTTALYAPEGGGSGGGGSSVPADAIIDVEKLPDEEAYLFKNSAKVEEYLMRKVVVYIVDTLPEVGELFLTSTSCNIYYQKGDDEAYCYLTPDVPPGGNFTGWAGLSSGFGWVSDFGYGGVITDESQATNTSLKYLVYQAGDINEKAFYRVPKFNVSTLFNDEVNMLDKPVTVHVVDTLPTTGESVMQGNLANPSSYVIYYQKSDNSVYAWVPTDLGVPTDMWLPVEDVLAMQGVSYGGVITSAEEAIEPYTLYVLVKIIPKLFHYKDGWHEIGGGSGASGVARFDFIQPTKDAEGEKSTANGYDKFPINEESMTMYANLFAYINVNRSKITNIHIVSSIGIICPVTVVGSILYCSFSNLGISHEYLSQLELGEGYIKMKSDDLAAAFVTAQFTIVVTTA